jgi:hypothetical protein
MTLEVAKEGRPVRHEVIDLEIPHREREAVVDANITSSDARSTENHYTVNNNISTPNADSFRKSSSQILGEASVHIERMGTRKTSPPKVGRQTPHWRAASMRWSEESKTFTRD